jgi:4-amino-4-deoxy-L-arabinose transferase-like glycosyltransferase
MNAARVSAAREWLVIAGLTLAGAVLRAWAFGRLSLTHFDEGIYAFAGLWSVSPHGVLGLDPGAIAYAPPGFPILVGLSYTLFGISDYAAIAVSVMAGIATIPVVGWLGRRTFGPGAGAAAAALAAFSMAHVAFSRKALTDAPFLLTWLVAIGVGMRFVERPGFLRGLALGIAVGVAQNFKYNGWLAGAIVAAAALAGVLIHPEKRWRGPLLRILGWGLFAALVAGLVYAPWYVFVASHGGYGQLMRHHSAYVVPYDWRSNLSLQLGQAFALSGETYMGVATGLVAVAACGLATNLRRTGFAAGLFALLCSVQGYLPWWLGLGWSPWLLANSRPGLRPLGAWWLIMSSLTPLYHPYARLWLPLHALGWLLMAGTLSMLAASETTITRGVRERRALVGIAVACGVSAVIHTVLARPEPIAWHAVLAPDPSLRNLAFSRLPQKIPEKGVVLRLYARRPLAFYLSLQGEYRLQLEPDLQRASVEQPAGSWGVIDEVMAPPMVKLRPGQTTLRVQVDPVTVLDYFPYHAFMGINRPWSDVVLLAPSKKTLP